MVVDGGRAFLSNQETATNGCEEGHNHGRGLTKGELWLGTKVDTFKGTERMM